MGLLCINQPLIAQAHTDTRTQTRTHTDTHTHGHEHVLETFIEIYFYYISMNQETQLSMKSDDFFYYSVGDDDLQPYAKCDSMPEITGDCNDITFFTQNSDACLEKSLCDNRKKSELLLNTQTNSSGYIRVDDMKYIYEKEKMKCINYSLGIGIIIIMMINKMYLYFKDST